MNPATVACDVIVGLIGRWHDGELPADESDVYEQHLLFCPPCMTMADNYRLAIGMLPTVANIGPAPADLLAMVEGQVPE